MEHLTPAQFWTTVLGVASAVCLLYNAGKAIDNVFRAFKAPNAEQDKRLANLEKRMATVEKNLTEDFRRFKELGDGNRITQRALLALLGHGLDGNNIDEMRHAKEELQNHLIDK